MSANAQHDDDAGMDPEQEDLLKMQERIGQVVGGKYKIVRALGVGGMGGVYEAEHELIGKRVALKCLHREYAREKDLVERFKREARAATVIGHENIIDVTDMGDLPDGAPFLVMEILRGKALASLMDELGPMPIGRTVRITRQVCFALAAAHEKGIVHRDMKPENVFLTTRGNDPDFVKVLDFGISKMHEHGKNDRGLTRTGVAMGTPSYMSPEQAQGSKDVDARTDVWAVGVMLYEMLAGRRPFEADSYPMMLMAIVGRDPDPVRMHRRDVPEELDRIVLRCLEKPMGTRMQSMRELADALAPFAEVAGEPEIVGGGSTRAAAEPSSARLKGGEAGDAANRTRVTGGGESTGERTPAPHTRVAGGTPDRGRESELKDVTWTAGETAAPKREPQATGELGTSERAEPRSTRERTAAMEGVEAGRAPASARTPLLAGGVVVVLLAVGGAFALGSLGGGAEPPAPVAPPAPAATAAAPAPTPEPPAPAPAPVVAPPPVPAEVHVEITTNPPNATIEIGDVTFPNPLSAARPRSLDPTTIRVSLEGYQTVERLVILDQPRSFHFELARGRGVRHEDAEGRVRAPAAAPAETPRAGGSSGGDRFREEF